MADAGINSVERTKNKMRAPDARRLPTGDGLKIRQNLVEPAAQIGQYDAKDDGCTIA